MALAFSPDNRKLLNAEIAKYPQAHSALIPALHIALAQFGHLSPEAMECVAAEMDLPVSDVQAVATFYTMFHTKPVGRHHIQVCQNLSCSLFGAESLIDYLERRHGVRCGEITADGRFSLARVECLASCGTAPVVQINDTYYEQMTPQKLDELLAAMK